jgi:hypothetical protein
MEGLHEFFFTREARFVDLFLNDYEHQVFTDKNQAWETCLGIIRQGYHVERAEVICMEVPDIREFGNPNPIPAYEAGRKLVVHLANSAMWRAQWGGPAQERMMSTVTEPVPNRNITPDEMREHRQAFGESVNELNEQLINALRSMATAGSCGFMVGEAGGQRESFRVMEQQHERMDKVIKEQIASKEKALNLFLSCLSASELDEFKSFSTVTVWTKIGVFRIDAACDNEPAFMAPPTYNVYSGNDVYCLNVGSNSTTPHSDYPLYDHILAQILFLKTNPRKFIEVANQRPRM